MYYAYSNQSFLKTRKHLELASGLKKITYVDIILFPMFLSLEFILAIVMKIHMINILNNKLKKYVNFEDCMRNVKVAVYSVHYTREYK